MIYLFLFEKYVVKNRSNGPTLTKKIHTPAPCLLTSGLAVFILPAVNHKLVLAKAGIVNL
jgi:hypothetical protein